MAQEERGKARERVARGSRGRFEKSLFDLLENAFSAMLAVGLCVSSGAKHCPIPRSPVEATAQFRAKPTKGRRMKTETLNTATAILSAAIQDKTERAEVLALLKPKAPTREKILTTRAACELAGAHPKTLFRWAAKGYLHPARITPSRVRWRKSELETFLCETAGA